VIDGEVVDEDLPWGTLLSEEDEDVPVGIPLDEDLQGKPVALDECRIAHVRLPANLDPIEAVRRALEALGQSEQLNSPPPSPRMPTRLHGADAQSVRERREGSPDGKVLE
jgi:hypothetical protein